jgi:maltooligosyltrehalose trehalohydrolase
VDYGFVIDGEGPYPDPRSAWQPNGVNGLSRIVDHGAFQWTDRDFQTPPLETGILYELHVGTMSPEGTFEAIIGKLDHLKGLGVTHLELMPVNTFSGRHGWGYDGVDLFAVHDPYGGPHGLKRLVDACHGRGFAVILDVVYNHFGPAGNYFTRFAPYLNHRHHTAWGAAVNVDGPFSDEVRRFFCDNALMWLRDYHIDGLRLDAVHAILDTSAEHFLEQLAREVRDFDKKDGRRHPLIAESDLNDPRLLHAPEQGGFGLDAQWSDDFHHALHVCLTGERNGYYEDFGTIADLAKAFRQSYVYDGRFSGCRRRRHGRSPRGLSGHRFLAYMQNHDQVGNRAQGDRISHRLDIGRVKIGAALVRMAPFIPMLFMGEEWAASTPFQYFTSHPDPELGLAVQQGRRREFVAFGWKEHEIPDPQDVASLECSRLKWEELSQPPHKEVLAWYRDLIQLRRSEPALLVGRVDQIETRFDVAERWLVVERGPFTILSNFSDEKRRVSLNSRGQNLLMASANPDLSPDGAVLPPASVAIFRRD